MTIRERHRSGSDTPSSAEVRSLLAAAGAPTEPGPVPGEEDALAMFRAVARSRERSGTLSSLTPLRVTIAASATAGLLLTGGVSAAVAGALPGAAQDTARTMLAKVGVTVPGADEAAAGHADERGPATDRDAASDGAADTHAAGSGKGDEVSDLARTTDATGVDKGAEVSGLASDGSSRAGRHGAAAAPDGDRSGADGPGSRAGGNGREPQGHRPTAEPPRARDAGTAADQGQQQADQASGDHSGNGPGDRP